MGDALEAVKKAVGQINASEKAKYVITAWDAAIEFDLDGEDGPFHLLVKDAKIELAGGAAADPLVAVKGAADAVAKAARGEIDITHPVQRGQLKLAKGKMIDLIRYNRAVQAALKDAK